MSSILAQNERPEEPMGSGPNGRLSPLEAEAIGLFVQLGSMVGQPRSFAEVYGMLFISTSPLPVDDLVERLGNSRASVERSIRFLLKAGLLRMVYVPGDRRLHYEAVAELRHLAVGLARDQLLPQLAMAESRINRLAEVIRELPAQQRTQLSSRVSMLQRWEKKGRNIALTMLKLLGG